MQQLLSPKQVAKSVGASESSLKRWCDQGLIPTEKTPGGHRRIRLRDAIQFVRDRGEEIIEPEILGLPQRMGQTPNSVQECVAPLVAALDSGDTLRARQIVLGRYLARIRIAEICDQLLMPAMHQLGHEWQCGRLEVYQERRACEVVNQLLFELQTIGPQPHENGLVAIGGAPEEDQYRLATQMVALALVEEGWRASSLGSNLPLQTIETAVEEQAPRLLWLSLTTVDDSDAMIEGLQRLADKFQDRVNLVIGGQGLTQPMLSELQGFVACDGLITLQQHVRTLR